MFHGNCRYYPNHHILLGWNCCIMRIPLMSAYEKWVVHLRDICALHLIFIFAIILSSPKFCSPKIEMMVNINRMVRIHLLWFIPLRVEILVSADLSSLNIHHHLGCHSSRKLAMSIFVGMLSSLEVEKFSVAEPQCLLSK